MIQLDLARLGCRKKHMLTINTASVPAVPAAVPYDEADAKQAWWDLEMETYRARKGRKGGPRKFQVRGYVWELVH